MYTPSMQYMDVVQLIEQLAENKSLNFQEMSEKLEASLAPIDREDLLLYLEYAGIIPEKFGHDSTEEKLYARFCDILMAESLNTLGIKSNIMFQRAEAPDVVSEVSDRYKMVGDAKAFRLSRTAKNQKDFKVEALNSWRRGADYACMVCPLYQYPTTRSQIYTQAIRFNVTLISYTHLHLMIRYASKTGKIYDLEPLWATPKTLNESSMASNYWNAVNKIIFELVSASPEDWRYSLERTKAALLERAEAEISFWKAEKNRIREKGHEELIKELIRALKIDSKIDTIRRISQTASRELSSSL
jgi:type II restriction enzyme